MLYVSQYVYQHKLDGENYLLFNTLTGAVDVVHERLAGLLKPTRRLNPEEVSPDELELLTSRGYLGSEAEDKKRVEQWFAEYQDRMRNLWFIVCPTHTCNLRCPYCYEDLEMRRSKTTMSPEQVEQMFRSMDQLVEDRKATSATVEFFGGEPFLRANLKLVEGILERAVERGWTISGISNGTQIDAYFGAFDRFRDHIRQVQITMDGAEEFHNQLRVYPSGRGSYDQISQNVSRLLQMGIPVLLRVNTGPENVASLPALFAAFEASGWTQYDYFQCQIAPINDHGCTGSVQNYQPEFKLLSQLHNLFDNWERARERYHLNLGYDMERRTKLLRRALYGTESAVMEGLDLSGCSASKYHYVVFGADGHLYACPETVGITDVAIGQFYPEFRLDHSKWSKWEVNISKTSKCLGCNIAPVCGGACPWHGFNASSFDAYEPHCNYAQQTISTYLELNHDRIWELLDGSSD